MSDICPAAGRESTSGLAQIHHPSERPFEMAGLHPAQASPIMPDKVAKLGAQRYVLKS
jgi:hypothetical protein